MHEPNPQDAWNDNRVETIVGHLLRIGVIISAVVVLIGGAMYLKSEWGSKFDSAAGSQLHSVHEIIRDAKTLRPLGVIALGLLLLIATPVARVVFTVFAFWMERDFRYVCVTLVVLVGLLFSLFFGHLLTQDEMPKADGPKPNAAANLAFHQTQFLREDHRCPWNLDGATSRCDWL